MNYPVVPHGRRPGSARLIACERASGPFTSGHQPPRAGAPVTFQSEYALQLFDGPKPHDPRPRVGRCPACVPHGEVQ